MNHPTREEWMAYLYNELSRSSQAILSKHLEDCLDCQKTVAEWRGTMTALTAWQPPKKQVSLPSWQPAFKWGIAALFVLSLGYGLGRFSVPAANLKKVQAGLESSLRASLEKKLREQMQDDLRAEIQNMHAATQRQLTNHLKQAYSDMNTLADKALAVSDEQAQRLLAAYEEKRHDEDRPVWTALNNLDTRQRRLAAEYASFRREVETLAVLTENNFERVQLASYNETAHPPQKPSGKAGP